MRKPVLLLTLVMIITAVVLGSIWVRIQQGFSARAQPSAIERYLAVGLRRAAVPSAARRASNPFSTSPELLVEAQAHFADHCASCHANNGSGDTAMGRGLYPRAPDMRKADTQSLTDGELYWIIHNGIRLSGMPAWGDPDHDDDSWKLVVFIRHLPSMTPDEESEMENLNPKSPAELQEEERDRRFLAGDEQPAAPTHSERKPR
jgi:mono/diheme cytochrome c family protein